MNSLRIAVFAMVFSSALFAKAAAVLADGVVSLDGNWTVHTAHWPLDSETACRRIIYTARVHVSFIIRSLVPQMPSCGTWRWTGCCCTRRTAPWPSFRQPSFPLLSPPRVSRWLIVPSRPYATPSLHTGMHSRMLQDLIIPSR